MALLAYMTRRLVQGAALVLVIVVINFALVHLAPGDPILVLVGERQADPDYVARLRAEFGLDRPLLLQLVTYLGRTLTLDNPAEAGLHDQ